MALLLPLNSIGQDFTEGVCRMEDGLLVFRIDLGWTSQQVQQVALQFDLDTVLLTNIIKGQADSLLHAEGWKLKMLNDRTAEISRKIRTETRSREGSVARFLSQLFLLDDRMRGKAPPEFAWKAYGVNRLTHSEAFIYKDTLGQFFLPAFSDAREVFLSGTFNSWSTRQTPMQHNDNGWKVVMPLNPGRYAYKYIVDGQWLDDPNNELREDDLNGGFNSVVYGYNYRFTLDDHLSANEVFVAGSFNGFNPGELEMFRTQKGWELPLYLDPGTHAYKFVIDGNWITDPANPAVRPDGQGNFNSFLGIGDPTLFRLEGFETAGKVILTGSFNAWNETELAMEKVVGGWELPYVLAPGNYEYKFIADGRWLTDPGNPYTCGEGDYANSFISVSPNHTFHLDQFPEAGKVIVAGNFNNWNETACQMIRLNNQWTLPLYLEPGKIIYKFIVDGNWMLDPDNELWEENEYGTSNSVLWIDN